MLPFSYDYNNKYGSRLWKKLKGAIKDSYVSPFSGNDLLVGHQSVTKNVD